MKYIILFLFCLTLSGCHFMARTEVKINGSAYAEYELDTQKPKCGVKVDLVSLTGRTR